MDNFIDRLAQKFIAGEVIKANSAAEEKELKKLREQVTEYERCLQEMRKVQMTNTQTAQNLHDSLIESTESFRKLTRESAEAVQKLTAESVSKIADIQLETDVQKAEAKKAVETAVLTMEQMEEKVVRMQETVAKLTGTMEKNQQEIEEWFRKADDYLHKENVKVYRNVQAVIVEEVGNKADAVIKAQEEAVKKSNKPVLVFAVLGFLAATASVVLQVLDSMGILLF